MKPQSKQQGATAVSSAVTVPGAKGADTAALARGATGRHGVALAGAVGNALEWYDFTVYGYGAGIIGKSFFPSSDPTVSLLAAYGVFAAAFLVRPLGSVVFGHIADRHGRKPALTISVAMMALSTVAIGLLPTYAAVGATAAALLITLRLIQGLSVGGEFTTSITFLAEESPPERRGLYCSWPSCTAGVGQLLGSSMFLLVETLLPPADVAAWGWRIPFLFGIVLGGVALWLRHTLLVHREPLAADAKLPIVEAVRSDSGALVRGFLISAAAGVAIYLGLIYLRNFIQQFDHVSASTASWIGTVGTATLVVLTPVFGAASDRLGRRAVMMTGAVAFIVLAWPIFWLMTRTDVTLILAGELVYMLALAVYLGPLGAMLTELFGPRIRCSGTSVSYNLALGLLGGTTPAISVFLVVQTGFRRAAAAWLMAAAITGLVGVWMSRERSGESLDVADA
jgi:MFS transporter, MHS family, proline/betaine transporter